jgi:hypothetical protein
MELARQAVSQAKWRALSLTDSLLMKGGSMSVVVNLTKAVASHAVATLGPTR